jgi:hypothetical protein
LIRLGSEERVRVPRELPGGAFDIWGSPHAGIQSAKWPRAPQQSARILNIDELIEALDATAPRSE